MKVLIVFGTRPEAIKMAPLVKKMNNHNKFEVRVCVTGQHREMLDQVLDIFSIRPDIDLRIMEHGQDLYDVSSKVLLGMRDVLRNENPDYVFVHGDTTTSTFSALAAFYEKIPVVHVEAGLRTFNKYSPWPEEINRQLTGRITTIHFAPTETSRENLLKEGISEENIYVTGNTVIDAMYLVIDRIENQLSLKNSICKKLTELGLPEKRLEAWKNKERKFVLITGHRRENIGKGFENICGAISDLSKQHPNVDFVYPVHLNPNVRKTVEDTFGDGSNLDNIFLIDPLEYVPFVYLMSLSYLILTDSGGIQEEGPGLDKPVLVMRDTTERPEAIEAGTVILVGTDRQLIVKEVGDLLANKNRYESMRNRNNPYGDGTSSDQIINVMECRK